jgi:hypothetical protein
MIGYLILAGFLLCGCVTMDALLARRDRLVRLWLGLCAGLVMMMWLPALFAFVLHFDRAAQLLGLAVAAATAGVCAFIGRKRPRSRHTDMPLWLPLALVVPLALLGGYLQYTHILRNVNGALHVGQSTYGDLCLHLGIATSLRGASFPPDYSLLPGTLLGYPFLGDTMVTTMLLFGSDLTHAFVVTGTLMMALVFLGFVLFCWELTHSPAATVVATALMFVNGGLGFLYALDGVGKDATAFQQIFTGFYRTPTNQPDLNLRWVNVICDMMIPQRTLLAGWMALLPTLWLLLTAARDDDVGAFAVLGVFAGALPMIHTHSFLALGLISAGVMAYALFCARGRRMPVFLHFSMYGVIALALALPQLITWSVPQTVNGGSLRFRFNWVNSQENGQLIDGYCWFWIKNVGLIWLMMVPAALTGERKLRDSGGPMAHGSLTRMLGLGALCIYVTAELIQFQPNIYDNNKLFYVAYMAMMPAVGLYLVTLWQRLRGVKGRVLLSCVFILVSTLSGALTIAREVVSDYELFDSQAVHAAAYFENNTPAHAVVLTGNEHNNPIAALAGRNIVCGTSSYLYFHGVDYFTQEQDERLMLEAPGDNLQLLDRYDVDYVYISAYERNDFEVDEAWFADHCDTVFAEEDICVYRKRGVHWKSTQN